jgi:hypothetical protein
MMERTELLRSPKGPLPGLVVLALFAGLMILGFAAGETEWFQVVLILAFGALMLLWAHQVALGQRSRRLPGGAPPGTLECEIIPRQDGTSADLKALGQALDKWVEGHAVPSVTTVYALEDLRAGELPRPLLTAFEGYLDAHRERHQQPALTGAERVDRHRQLLHKLGELAHRRTVFVRVQDAESALRSLRESLPAGLVEDVLIDGHSWEEAH